MYATYNLRLPILVALVLRFSLDTWHLLLRRAVSHHMKTSFSVDGQEVMLFVCCLHCVATR